MYKQRKDSDIVLVIRIATLARVADSLSDQRSYLGCDCRKIDNDIRDRANSADLPTAANESARVILVHTHPKCISTTDPRLDERVSDAGIVLFCQWLALVHVSKTCM